MNTSFDYIVVGSGINALVCAAMLGGKGQRVLVLERNDRIGGCMRSDEITAPGFVHDVMATTFILFVTGPAYSVLGADIERLGVEFCNTDTPHAVVLPDGRHLVIRRDRDDNVQALDALAAGDGANYRRDMEGIEKDAALLFGLLGGRLWSFATLKLLLTEAWRRGPLGLKAVMGNALTPARSWLESSYRSDVARALWAPWSLHAGLGPEDAFSGQIGKVIGFSLEAGGSPIVKGGAGRLLSAFSKLIAERSGTIRTQADVVSVIRTGGRATGVRIASGAEFSAAKGVICSMTPTQLYERLLGGAQVMNEPDAVANYRHGKGNFQMHYALDRMPAWKNAELAQAALVHLTAGIDGVSKACNEALRGMLPELPTICVQQPHVLDPSRCPPGKAILWLQMPEAPRFIKGDAAGLLGSPEDGRWTESLREAYADRVEAMLAAHIDGFQESIIARRAYSPADIEAMNINLVGGDPYGGSSTIDQAFLWRPFKHSVNHKTDVEGLYLIGASTHPGSGLGGGSGFLLAQHLTG
nr:NAD(P)/FAD-dependent oxidoreductase [Mesorhizobium loti]